MRSRVVVIGAGGHMISLAVATLAASDAGIDFVLTDIDEAALSRLARDLGGRTAVATQVVDLFDRSALDAVVSGADLVVNGSGPAYRTAPPVMQACLRNRVPYLDLDDDVESTVEALSMDEQARDAGVSLLIGCGLSPGLTNVIARELVEQLDTVRSIEMAGVVAGGLDDELGTAVLDHTVSILTNDFEAWHDGTRVSIPSYSASAVMPFRPPIGTTRVYEVAHPEAVTLPVAYPSTRVVRMFLAMHPQALNGLARGVASAYRDGRMTKAQVVEFLGAVMAGKRGTGRGWRAALRGIVNQLIRRENGPRDVLHFFWNSLRGNEAPFFAELLWRVEGSLDGQSVALVRRLLVPPDSRLKGMASMTGRAAAAFICLALERPRPEPGVLAPENWASPEMLQRELLRLGYPSDAITAIEKVALSP